MKPPILFVLLPIRRTLLATECRYSFSTFSSFDQWQGSCRSMCVSSVAQSSKPSPSNLARQMRIFSVSSNNSRESRKQKSKDYGLQLFDLPQNISKQMLHYYFSRFGTVLDCKLVPENIKKCSAEVIFAEKNGLLKVFGASQSHEINGHVIAQENIQPLKSFEVVVERLNPRPKIETLRQYFSSFGQPFNVYIMRHSKHEYCCAYVSFATKDEVDKVLSAHHHCLDGIYYSVRRFYRKEMTFYVGGLLPSITDETLRTFYSKFGQLIRAEVWKSRLTQKSRCCGFVTFEHQDGVNEALRKQPHVIDGKEVKLQKNAGLYLLHVSSLPQGVAEKTIADYFSQYDVLFDCELYTASKIAIVAFATHEGMLKALESDAHVISNNNVKIRPVNSIPNDRVVLITGMRQGTAKEAIGTYCSIYGKVLECELNLSTLTAHVIFSSVNDAQKILNTGPHYMNGQKLILRPCL